MKLISCDTCGVVLDGDKLNFPDEIYTYDGSIDDKLAVWNGDSFVPKVQCPVCHADILKD